MRKLSRSISVIALFLAAAAPCFAGIHYKATTTMQDAAAKSNQIQVEGWVSGDDAKVAFLQSGGNPVAQEGTYIVTKDGGRTLYLVNPEEKSYAKWDIQGMLGAVGAVMNGMGPLLKIQFSEPKVEKLAEDDGGTVQGLPTRHYKYRTSYNMTVKVLGMGNTSDVVTEQDVWTTSKLQDAGLSVWLRAEPPRTGNTEFDKLLTSEAYQLQGFPLKTVTVSTSTPKKGKPTTTRSTMEVTQLNASATVPASAFEIPAGYQETQLLPTTQEAEQQEGQQEEEQGGLRGLLKKRKPPVE
ncbi:MAG TPA: DUF4412 domain-containing protein [Thermoanaerobaculia bacterium]